MAYSGLVFAWDHNWKEAIPERLLWLTDAIEHRDASEQRRTVRLDPRRQLEYSVLPLTIREKGALENFLYIHLGEAVMLPIWTDAQTLRISAASGQPVVEVDTVGYDFDAGAHLCLWKDWLTYEVVQIDSLDETSVTLTENLAATWPAGTVVLPARLARFTQQQDGTRYGGNIASYRLTFEIDEASRSVNRVDATSPPTYEAPVVGAVEVYRSASDWAETLPVTLSGLFGLVDPQTGVVAVDRAAKERPVMTYQHAEKMFSRTEISAFLGFLTRRAGRRAPFWTPTQEDDFKLLSIGFETLTIESCGYSRDVYPTGMRGHLALICCRNTLFYERGRQIYRPIRSATDNEDGTETLHLWIASDFSGGDAPFLRLSLLRYCRLESDAVEITWIAPTIATARLGFRELPNYPPTPT